MPITPGLTFPPDSTEEERGFATFLHYLESICGLVAQSSFPRSRLIQHCAASAPFGRINRNTSPNLQLVGRRLRNAWSTEIALRLPGQLG